MTKTIYILNGPNMNMLGVRDPKFYGTATLADIDRLCHHAGDRLGLEIVFRQSNHEGQLIDWIHEGRDAASGFVINPGALTHTSIGLLDAFQVAEKPVIEVHLSNVFQRESFRHHSYVSLAARGVICGLGAKGYELALEALAEILA